MILEDNKNFPLRIEDAPISSRYFLKFFKKKSSKPKFENAIPPEKLKQIVKDIGKYYTYNLRWNARGPAGRS